MSISDSWATTASPTNNRQVAEEEARSWIPGLIVFFLLIIGFAILATPVQLDGTPYREHYETEVVMNCVANEDLPDPRYADEDKVDGQQCTTTTTALSDAGALGIGFVVIFAFALAVVLVIASAVKESTRKVALAMIGFGIILLVVYESLKGQIDESKLDIAARGGIAALVALVGLYASKRVVQTWFQPKTS